MTRQPFRLVFAGLIALVMLRALMPVGYMPVAIDGHLDIVLCDGQGGLPPASHAHHHHHGGKGAPQGAVHGDEGCTYAQSAHAALAPTLDPGVARASPLVLASMALQQGLIAEAPFRHSAPRGPPLFV